MRTHRKWDCVCRRRKKATGADSTEAKWSHIHPSRYGDIIRKTDRITYTDAGSFAPISCDATGDGNADMIFANTHGLHVVPYIPYGSGSDDLTRPLEQQPNVLTVAPPETTTTYGRIVTCLPGGNNQHTIAVADQNAVHIYARGTKGAAPTFVTTIDIGETILALAGTPQNAAKPAIAIGVKDGVHLIDTATMNDARKYALTELSPQTWAIDGAGGMQIVPVESPLGHFAVSSPAQQSVYYARTNATAEQFKDKAITVTDRAGNSAFGHALTVIGDLNDDQIPDLAIGAPSAHSDAGAVALVFSPEESVNVDTASTTDTAIQTTNGDNGGYLLRSALYGRLGASLAWIDGGNEAGALLVGRPQHGEHAGGLIISATALHKHHNSGGGVDDIESSRIATIAAEEGGQGDTGTNVGIIPRRSNDPLVGIYTANSRGKVHVWTVDMSRQSDTYDESTPLAPPFPPPPNPSAEPALAPIDTPKTKSWLGEFTSGFGASLARGRCDVTGDGKADIISGSPVRSEWKWDPYYADSTETKGWVFNVTGQIHIIPGGTPGASVPNAHTITINGPRQTHDPATDSAIGLSVACLGDVNGDSIDDFAFSSHTIARVWVIFGGPHLSNVDLNNLSAEHGWAVELPENGSGGFHLSRVGDVNADGYADLGFVVANAAYAAGKRDVTQGSAFIVKGKGDGSTVDLKNIDHSNQQMLKRIDTPRGHTMSAFTDIGDVNADGVHDYLVADFQHLNKDFVVSGIAWVVYGNTAEKVTAGMPGVGYTLTMPFDVSHRLGAGNSIAPVGDVNADGVNDFVIGFDGGTIVHQGSGGVALVRGMRSPIGVTVEDVHISPLHAEHSSPRVSIITGTPDHKGIGFGYSVDAVQREGSSTLIAVGAWGYQGNGRVYLLTADQFKHPVSSIDNIHAQIFDSAGIHARFGRSVAFIGDFLDETTLAMGGDGVIDEHETDRQGYAHSAHVLATRIATPNNTPSRDSESTGPTPHSQSPHHRAATAALARTGFIGPMMLLAVGGLVTTGLVLRRMTRRQ